MASSHSTNFQNKSRGFDCELTAEDEQLAQEEYDCEYDNNRDQFLRCVEDVIDEDHIVHQNFERNLSLAAARERCDSDPAQIQ
jgi:hypothetical protein